MNILILSAGTRNKVVEYFKRELDGKGQVFATDCSPLAPALYEADRYFIVPKMTDAGYLDTILNLCKSEHVDGVLSLIDPELTLLAENKQAFLDVGTVPVISPPEAVETAFDKFKMFRFLTESGLRTAKTYSDISAFRNDYARGKIRFPVFVKPVLGSASININKVSTMAEVELLCAAYDNLIIQEFMDGDEYGADVYIDMLSGEPVSMFIKKKIKMRAGETDKSVSVINPEMRDYILNMVRLIGFRGIIDVDLFDVDGEYYISEVNPRFGGGYPHAYECGVNVPELIVNNLGGKENEPCFDNYNSDIYMMKYSEITILGREEN